MEHSRTQYGRQGIRMANIVGDPFALATISISALAWIIAFFGAIFGAIQTEKFPNFTWFSLIICFFVIVGVFVVIASDAVQTYHVALVGYLSLMLSCSASQSNQFVYSVNGARQASAAGFILLTMISIVWIFYFGSAPSATPRAYIDSFALAKESSLNRRHTMGGGYGGGRPETSTSVQPPQMYTAQLNGLENPSPVGGMPSSTLRNSAIGPQFSSGMGGPANMNKPTPSTGTTPPGTEGGGPGGVDGIVPPTEYPYRAKAIYSYEANPDDANEISFSKHEILEVSDVSGRWWQARKETGETGIAPSNYLILL